MNCIGALSSISWMISAAAPENTPFDALYSMIERKNRMDPTLLMVPVPPSFVAVRACICGTGGSLNGPGGRGVHASISRVNASAFVGYGVCRACAYGVLLMGYLLGGSGGYECFGRVDGRRVAQGMFRGC